MGFPSEREVRVVAGGVEQVDSRFAFLCWVCVVDGHML